MEYLGSNMLSRYMGVDDPNAMVYVEETLTKEKGDSITMSLVYKLQGEGIKGSGTLEGNEEALRTAGQAVVIDEYSHATRDDGSMTRKRVPFDFTKKQRPALTNWMAEKAESIAGLRMHSIDGEDYDAASTSDKNTWHDNNSDRILYGASRSNHTASDHASSLGNVDSSTDVCTASQLKLIKRMAKLANPKIRPIKMKNGEPWFLYFAHPYTIRDLKDDAEFQQAQREALPRGYDNPIFTGAAGIFDGIILHEWEECPILEGVGAGSIDVAANFLCGAQALLYAQGGYEGAERMRLVEETFDYGRQIGSAIMSLFEIEKAVFNPGTGNKDHGILTHYTAGVAD